VIRVAAVRRRAGGERRLRATYREPLMGRPSRASSGASARASTSSVSS